MDKEDEQNKDVIKLEDTNSSNNSISIDSKDIPLHYNNLDEFKTFLTHTLQGFFQNPETFGTENSSYTVIFVDSLGGMEPQKPCEVISFDEAKKRLRPIQD